MATFQWVRMDGQWSQNPKFLQLIMDNRWRAIAVYWAALGWSGVHGEGGFVPFFALPSVHGTKREATILVEVGLWEPVEGAGWQIHDWLEYQPSDGEQEARKKRARLAAEARWRKVGAVGS